MRHSQNGEQHDSASLPSRRFSFIRRFILFFFRFSFSVYDHRAHTVSVCMRVSVPSSSSRTQKSKGAHRHQSSREYRHVRGTSGTGYDPVSLVLPTCSYACNDWTPVSLVLSRAPKKTLRPGQDTIDEALLFIIIKKESTSEALASPTETYGKKKNAAYRPLTGQFVCPDHPMQKPHLREGVIFPSASIAVLSKPASKLDAAAAKNESPDEKAAACWTGRVGFQNALTVLPAPM